MSPLCLCTVNVRERKMKRNGDVTIYTLITKPRTPVWPDIQINIMTIFQLIMTKNKIKTVNCCKQKLWGITYLTTMTATKKTQICLTF